MELPWDSVVGDLLEIWFDCGELCRVVCDHLDVEL